MMKTNSTKIGIFLLLLLISFGKFYAQTTTTTNGAVGINTTVPNTNSVLDIVSGDNDKGILVPRLTEAERDAIAINKPTDDGLTIYNTSEDCINYWSYMDDEWKSLCGQLGKAVFTVDCALTEARGSYVQGKELTNSNYLSITVNVTKVGNYTITGTTTNGYNFYGTGAFLSTGTQTIQVIGQGIPTNIQTDAVAINANGTDVTCTPPVTIEVLSPAGTYTLSCGSATVNGVYKVGVALTTANTITLPVNVTALGSYTITTDTVDGISFTGSGTFSATGNQNVTLYGNGTPTSTTTKTMTITSDSQGAVSTTCSVQVIIVVPKKKLLTSGYGQNDYGYNFSGTANSNKLITTATNFGTLANSVVKYEGWDQIINAGDDPTEATLTANLTGDNPVDIFVMGQMTYISDAEAAIIAQYVANGGVVLSFVENPASSQSILRAIFNDRSITTTQAGAGGAGSMKSFPVSNDEVLTGPFGNIAGKYWGEDASATTRANGLPVGDIITYSTGDYDSTAGISGSVTALRHKTLNFIWVGDGGFNSGANMSPASGTICPFNLDASNYPIPKTTYSQPAQNSIFTANAFAWAIKQAEANGINKQ
ncbi:hypothetical protein [Chryseobacterium sp. CT-SW4]|uniref:hypothetical protein n=1 Tax=Chryseobacterium sp. SW-1 TaxID=3157343 RepID=UPI003B017D6D